MICKLLENKSKYWGAFFTATAGTLLGGTHSSVGQLEIIMLARKKKLKLTSKDNSDTVN